MDWLNNYTALILGHGHPAVVNAVTEQLRTGACFAFSTELECEAAQLLVGAASRLWNVSVLPGQEPRPPCSPYGWPGAYTGRQRIAKMEGGFHGTYDDVMVCVRTAATAGRSTVPDSAGLRPRLDEDVLVLPFNDPDATLRLLGGAWR